MIHQQMLGRGESVVVYHLNPMDAKKTLRATCVTQVGAPIVDFPEGALQETFVRCAAAERKDPLMTVAVGHTGEPPYYLKGPLTRYTLPEGATTGIFEPMKTLAAIIAANPSGIRLTRCVMRELPSVMRELPSVDKGEPLEAEADAVAASEEPAGTPPPEPGPKPHQ
jgi:hypothetical protein